MARHSRKKSHVFTRGYLSRDLVAGRNIDVSRAMSPDVASDIHGLRDLSLVNARRYLRVPRQALSSEDVCRFVFYNTTSSGDILITSG